MKALFPNYKKGSNLTILNTLYYRPMKHSDGKYHDAIDIIAYDLDNEKTVTNHIVDPEYEFYHVKDDADFGNYGHLACPIEKLDKVTCKFKDLDKVVAEVTGNMDTFWDNIKANNRAGNRKFYLDYKLFGADRNISDFYRAEFAKQYKNQYFSPRKGFLDIELKITEQELDAESEYGSKRINAVSFYNLADNRGDVFLLETHENIDIIKEFERDLATNTEDFYRRVIDTIMEAMNGVEAYEFLRDATIKFHFYPEEEEIAMIADLFSLINSSNVQFVMGWNVGFDMSHLINRCKTLGYDPTGVICDQQFIYKQCEYFVDAIERRTGNMKEFYERSDRASITGNVTYLDSLLLYCRRRRAASASQSNTLDDIAKKEAKCKKLDYSWTGANIATLCDINYYIFAVYNLVDTITNAMIEKNVLDVDYFLAVAVTNNTRLSCIERPTIDVINLYRKEWEERGYIMTDNFNAWNTAAQKEAYPGAYISDARWNSDFSKMKVFCKDTDTSLDRKYIHTLPLFNNTNDFDATAMYPSSMGNSNIGPNTQIGRLYIRQPIWKGEKHTDDKFFFRGSNFMEDLSSRDYISLGNRWFNLPGIEDLCRDIEELYLTHTPIRGMQPIVRNKLFAKIDNKAINIDISNIDMSQTNISLEDKKKTLFVSLKNRHWEAK